MLYDYSKHRIGSKTVIKKLLQALESQADSIHHHDTETVFTVLVALNLCGAQGSSAFASAASHLRANQEELSSEQ